jgi:hypothetical protein
VKQINCVCGYVLEGDDGEQLWKKAQAEETLEGLAKSLLVSRNRVSTRLQSFRCKASATVLRSSSASIRIQVHG